MKIAKIEVKNFKGLKDVYIEPSKFTCLVGENNAGKSSVLQAINLALKITPEIPEQLFYDSSKPILFQVYLSDVSDEDLDRLTTEQKVKISPYVLEGSICFQLTHASGQKVLIRIPTLVPKDARFTKDFIDQLVKGKAAEYNEAIKSAYPEWKEELPTFKKQDDAKQYIDEKVKNLSSDQLEVGSVELPTGMASSIRSLFPEPIYIPAVKSLSDDLKVSQSTSFGRLIALLLDDLEPDLGDINASLERLKAILNRVPIDGQDLDGRHPKVKNLEKKVEDNLKQQFPNVKIELEIPPPELKTILNSARIFVNDGSRDLIDNKGDGIKRSLTFSLLRVYVDHLEDIRKQENGSENLQPSPLFFLFEEPELYLHPKSQQILFSALEAISHQHSVVVTTHSPIFFHPGVTASFIRVKKEDAEPKPIGRLHHINFHLDPSKSESFLMAKYEKSEPAFFCSKVVILPRKNGQENYATFSCCRSYSIGV